MIGIFPTEDPRLIVYVVVQNPRGQSYYGSQIAAPIFREVAVGLMDKLGIPRAGTTAGASEHGSDGATRLLRRRRAAPDLAIGSAMPDLRGMPKKLLLPLLLRKDLAVTINGSGFVVTQDPAPGVHRPGRDEDRPGASVSFLAENFESLRAHRPRVAETLAKEPRPGQPRGPPLKSWTRHPVPPRPAWTACSSTGDTIPRGTRTARSGARSTGTARPSIAIGFGLGYGAEAARSAFPSLPLLVVEPDVQVFRAAMAMPRPSSAARGPRRSCLHVGMAAEGLPAVLETPAPGAAGIPAAATGPARPTGHLPRLGGDDPVVAPAPRHQREHAESIRPALGSQSLPQHGRVPALPRRGRAERHLRGAPGAGRRRRTDAGRGRPAARRAPPENAGRVGQHTPARLP